MLFIIDLASKDRQLLLIFLLGILDFLCMILCEVTDLLIQVVVLKLSFLLILNELINLLSILLFSCIVGYLFLLMLLEHGVEPIYNVFVRFLPKKG